MQATGMLSRLEYHNSGSKKDKQAGSQLRKRDQLPQNKNKQEVLSAKKYKTDAGHPTHLNSRQLVISLFR